MIQLLNSFPFLLATCPVPLGEIYVNESKFEDDFQRNNVTIAIFTVLSLIISKSMIIMNFNVTKII